MKKISPVTAKLFFIGLIIGILCISNALIGNKMKQRKYTYLDATNEIAKSAGNYFNLKNAWILIPYTEINNYKTTNNVLIQHATKIQYDTNLNSEMRTLGIYNSPVFTGTISIKSHFDLPKLTNNENRTYSFDKATIIIPMHSTSLLEKPIFTINNKTYDTFYNTTKNENSNIDKYYSGIACNIDLSNLNEIDLSTELKIRGSKEFNINLDSAETKLTIESDWPSPGFTEYSYLPDTRNITESGFTATWNIPFATESETKIGFKFIDVNNPYKKLERSHNYSFLFIIVPFIILFLFEVFTELNLHPMHYLLSGAASIIFFLLLLSLSEHIHFEIAYLISALASCLLVSLYITSITKKIKYGGIMSFMFILLYLYLLFCLKSEDYALLMGSLFAFIILAVIMFITRKVNWTNLKKSNNTALIEE